MRLAAALALLAFAASAYLAREHYAGRAGDLPEDRFVDPPAQRAERGKRERALGIELAGYEDRVAADPGDLDAVRGRIRAGLLLGAVALGQPDLDQLVEFQTTDYLKRRAEIDPDGSFLKSVLEEWVDRRLHFNWDARAGFYARTAAAMYLAARGDERGVDALFELANEGKFYLEYFPFTRRYHPGWGAVGPLVARYLEEGGLVGRVQAGATLLDYHVLFGVGEQEMERFLPEIRRSVKEVRGRLRRPKVEEATAAGGRAAVLAMGLLALLGNEAELKLVARAGRERAAYAPFSDTITIAQLMNGLVPFEKYHPLTTAFQAMEQEDQALYFAAAAYRAQSLRRSGETQNTDYRRCLRILESGFEGGPDAVRVFCIQALASLDRDLGNQLIARALDEKGTMSIYGAVLADLDDPVPVILPALRAPSPDLSALAGVSLLGRGDTRALQK